jgi:hypothetical protein
MAERNKTGKILEKAVFPCVLRGLFLLRLPPRPSFLALVAVDFAHVKHYRTAEPHGRQQLAGEIAVDGPRPKSKQIGSIGDGH